MTDQQKHAARISAEAVSMIDTLAKQPEFHHFLTAMRARADQYANEILDHEMPADRREIIRQRRIELMEVIHWHKTERIAHVAVLKSFGVNPGDGLEVGM